MQAALEVTAGPHAGRKIVLTPGVPVRIGRTAKSDYVVAEDTFLSSAHFAVEWSGDNCVVRDLTSSNGTFLNGTRVSEGPVREGDTITAGQSSFALRLDALGGGPAHDPAVPLDQTRHFRPPAPQQRAPFDSDPSFPFGAPPLPPPPPAAGAPPPFEPPPAPAAGAPQHFEPPPRLHPPSPFDSPLPYHPAAGPAHPAQPPPPPPLTFSSAPPALGSFAMPPPPGGPPPAAVAPPEPAATPLPGAESALLDILRGLADPVYAVLDSSLAAALLDSVRAAGGAVENVSETTCLTPLNADSAIAAQLASAGWGNAWGVYIASRQPPAILRNHLRRFQTLMTPDGAEFRFRFSNPALLRAFVAPLSAEEAKTFFGPIVCILAEGHDPAELLLFMPGPAGTLRKTVPLSHVPASA